VPVCQVTLASVLMLLNIEPQVAVHLYGVPAPQNGTGYPNLGTQTWETWETWGQTGRSLGFFLTPGPDRQAPIPKPCQGPQPSRGPPTSPLTRSFSDPWPLISDLCQVCR
jgi:hypothetical protein